MPSARPLTEEYLSAILEANERVNLTRITDHDQATLLHLEDSLVALPEMEIAPPGRYADLGSGGGFPGVPLALATGRETLLVDSVQKKMRVVSEVLEQLGLDGQIKTYGGRIEDLALEQPKAFAVVTARALSSLPSLLELASPLLEKDGLLVCFKAPVSSDEARAASIVAPLVGMELHGQRELVLSDGQTRRMILTYRKVRKPALKLPRRVGLAQKKPLSE